MYFTDITNIHLFIGDYYGDKLAHIELLDDQDIYIEDKKYKTNKFRITQIITVEEYINKLDYDSLKNILPHNGYILKYITNQNYELCKIAVQNNIYSIGYVKNDEIFITLYEEIMDQYNNRNSKRDYDLDDCFDYYSSNWFENKKINFIINEKKRRFG